MLNPEFPRRDHNHAQSKDTDGSQHLGDNTHGSNFRFDFSERALAIVALVLACLSVPISIVAICIAWWEIHEAKQVQIQLMYANAIMLREGMVQPGDMVYGPEGNLEYRQHELRKKEK